ncbi:hypothetical protein D3C73_1563290 [compost metagenome]
MINLLVTVNTSTGSYQKYKPTDEEAIELFSEWYNKSIVRPSEIYNIIKDCLIKWNMMYLYEKITIKMKEGKVNE